MLTLRTEQIIQDLVTETFNNDIGMNTILLSLKANFIDSALDKYVTQRDAANKLRVSSRVIGYYLRGK